MRELALTQYGCTELTAVSDSNYEVATSYWNKLDDIKAWKQDPDHLVAQTLGQSTWYKAYSVQIAEIVHEYNVTL